jgi:hypothetical protein
MYGNGMSEQMLSASLQRLHVKKRICNCDEMESCDAVRKFPLSELFVIVKRI